MSGTVYLFAGIGSEGLGIETNPDAWATRDAAGLETLQADVTELDPTDHPCELLIATPPCQDFSVAGKGLGIDGERGKLVLEVPR